MIIKKPTNYCNAYWIIPPVKCTDSCIELIDKACNYFNISKKILLGPKRNRFLLIPRYMIMHALLNNYKIRTGSKHVGRLMNRDHSTIIKGMKSFTNLLITDESYRKQLQEFHEYLYGHLDYYRINAEILK